MTVYFKTKVASEWIDYNGHMQDAYYGLIFSYAVDAFQDSVGFDRAYRAKTGCTIYLIEEHKYYFEELKEGDLVEVKIQVLDAEKKLFQLHCLMLKNGKVVAASELLEMHVKQLPSPHGVPIPEEIIKKLRLLMLTEGHNEKIKCRARSISIARNKTSSSTI